MLDASLVIGSGVTASVLLWLGFGRPRPLLMAPLAAVALACALVGVWKLSSVRAGVLGPTVLRVSTDAPVVALTLDDGPTVAYTKPVLDLLDAAGAKATFFVTGHELAGHPELGREILARGHQLGNHSWTHPRLIFRSRALLEYEIVQTDRTIRSVGQRGPIPFRPPYGKRLLDLHAVLGARPAVLWDVEPESYPALVEDPDALAQHVIDQARPGSIILLHAMYASRETTRLALPKILEGLAQRGLAVTSLEGLENAAHP